MSTELLTIPIFGLIGYFLPQVKKSSAAIRIDIALIILLIIAANAHGLGYSGIGELHIYHNDILQGLIGGILIRRTIVKGAAAV